MSLSGTIWRDPVMLVRATAAKERAPLIGNHVALATNGVVIMTTARREESANKRSPRLRKKSVIHLCQSRCLGCRFNSVSGYLLISSSYNRIFWDSILDYAYLIRAIITTIVGGMLTHCLC